MTTPYESEADGFADCGGIDSPMRGDPVAIAIVPVKTVSELNRREHWSVRQRRAKSHHAAVWPALIDAGVRLGDKALLPVHVHMVRLAPRRLDSDNLHGALKFCRDAVAKHLGVDDGDDWVVSWSVGQLPSKKYAVRIEFFPKK